MPKHVFDLHRDYVPKILERIDQIRSIQHHFLGNFMTATLEISTYLRDHMSKLFDRSNTPLFRGNNISFLILGLLFSVLHLYPSYLLVVLSKVALGT
jgi:hypothetical protein